MGPLPSDYSSDAYPVDSVWISGGPAGDLAVGRRRVQRTEPEQRLEGGHRGAAAVVAEYELVKVDRQMLFGDAAMGAVHPRLEV